MKTLIRKPILRLAVVVVIGVLAATACSGGGEEAGAPTQKTSTIAVQITAGEPSAVAAEPTATEGDTGDVIAFEAANAAIIVDGDTSDWDGIEPVTVPMEQIRIENLDPAQAEDIEFDPLPPIDVTFRVAADADNIYVLMEVPDDYNFDPEDHSLSPSMAIQFRIDDPAAIHMGSEEEDLEASQGVVDMWHWELDCGPGELAGGQGVVGGDDPVCNLDDEYAPNPEDREDDGGGDIENPNAENSLAGVWEHTARAQGPDADGTWVFEFSRPLQTGDPQDAQFVSGGTAFIALAYWDPDESATGWSDVGHLTSSYGGWIEVTLP